MVLSGNCEATMYLKYNVSDVNPYIAVIVMVWGMGTLLQAKLRRRAGCRALVLLLPHLVFNPTAASYKLGSARTF